MRRRSLIAAFAATVVLSFGAQAQQPFPSKPITWVVGFAAGGGMDAVTRLVAAKVSQNIGQPVIVENKVGASSIIAAQYVAQAAPDGYTIWSMEQGAVVFNTALYSRLPYDAGRDFTPVTNMIRAPLVLVVNASFPAKDLRSLIEMARKEPGKLNYGASGRGVFHHLGMEAFKERAGIDLPDVQYKGIAPAMQDVIGGQIPIAAIDTAVVLPNLRGGKLRGLASFSNARLPVTPEVPSLAELGYPDLDMAPIVGVMAPKATPREVVARLNAEIVRALKDPAVNARLAGLGLDIVGDTPEQFAAFLDSEGKRWLPLIRRLNIKLD
jgi:tripartite-type tricarboxylate transporter receptor subunit TctC